MITQILAYAGAQTGPFAKILAGESAAVLAVNPGERVSADLSGRTRLRLFPSGVFYPSIENYLPAQTRFSLDDWLKDARSLSARGYGPVKLRLDPRCVPEKDLEAVAPFLGENGSREWTEKGSLLIEGDDVCGCVPERVICVLELSALSDPALSAFLESRHVTELAVSGADHLPEEFPLPVWGWTLAEAPMKVLKNRH